MEKPGTHQEATPDSRTIAALADAISKDALPPPVSGSGGPGGPGSVAEEPEKVYTAAEVMDLVTLPAETMYALTGNERWILGAEEKKILSEKTAKALGLIMKIEPKWFIIASFVTALGSVYGTRALAEIKERMDKKKETKP